MGFDDDDDDDVDEDDDVDGKKAENRIVLDLRSASARRKGFVAIAESELSDASKSLLPPRLMAERDSRQFENRSAEKSKK